MNDSNLVGWVVGWMIIIVLFISIPIIIGIVGWHLNIGEGSHVGYVTAVETNGIFFKTDRAYIKTDAQSSQEDTYCIVDSEVKSDLRKASEARSLVELSYISWLSNGIINCGGEVAVITKVKIIK